MSLCYFITVNQTATVLTNIIVIRTDRFVPKEVIRSHLMRTGKLITFKFHKISYRLRNSLSPYIAYINLKRENNSSSNP